MVNKTFPVMDEVIQVRAMAESVPQHYIKLIGNVEAHKHSCALRPLTILNTGK